MRCLLVSQTPPSVGGIDRYSDSLAVALRGRLGPECVRVARVGHPHEVRPDEIPLVPTRWPVLARSGAMRALRGQPYDIVHFLSHLTTPSFLFATAPRAMTLHGLEHFIVPDEYQFRPNARRLRHLTFASLRMFQRRVGALIAVSQHIKDAAVEHVKLDPSRIFVARHGVTHGDFHPVDRGTARDFVKRAFGLSGPYLLHVSHRQAIKNVDRIIDAYRTLSIRTGINDISLVVAGPGSEAETSDERIRFLGPVRNNDTLRHLYAAAEAFVFPSIHESAGLPVLEAMACGTPVITSPVGGIPEYGGPACLYTDPFDTAGLANQMQRVLEESSLRERLSAAGVERASQFTWDRCAEAHLSAFESAVRSGR